MNVRNVIAVILGLLFQWAQMAHAVVSTEMERDVSTVHCDCCAELPSCPCAKDGNPVPERPPLPAPPDSLKLPAAKPADPRVELEETPAPQAPRVVNFRPATGPLTGYAGVRFSVAFCSFVM